MMISPLTKRMPLILDAGHFATFMQPGQFLCEPLRRSPIS
jgi:hypothetical protein